MFIIDFDDTLFDTYRFKEKRLEEVQRLGVSEEEYWRTYREARYSPDGLSTYSNERHADILGGLGYGRGEVLAMLKNTTGEALFDFLFSDTIDFLEALKKHKQKMILLSLGNSGFQKLKTDGVRITDYFDKVYITHDSKLHVLEQFLKTKHSEEVWFVNDKVDETMRVLNTFPFMKAVLKVSDRSGAQEYEDCGLPFFKTLTEIKNYIKEHV